MTNSKFNLSKGEEKKSSKFNLTKETVSAPGGNNDYRPKKNRLWIWLLLLAVAVVTVFCVKNCSSNSSENTEIESAADITTGQPATTSTEEIQSTDAESTTVGTDETMASEETVTPVNAEEVTTPQAETKPASTPASEPATEPTTSNVPVATLPQGNLEEKAKRVIRGDFGNGTERKQNLGSEYSAIQQKVNEMYREGKVN
jgi:cytoskeletal protein RodZ